MASVRGRDDVRRFLASLPKDIEEKLLRGAARAGAKVIAEDAKERSISEEVSGAIKVATSQGDGKMIGWVRVKGRGAYIAPWLEYGTAAHFISVDDSQRQGMSVGRINRVGKAGSLVINGQFVGSTILHPGARPHPFLRPALDVREADAIAAAQNYITTRLARQGLGGSPDPEGDEA